MDEQREKDIIKSHRIKIEQIMVDKAVSKWVFPINTPVFSRKNTNIKGIVIGHCSLGYGGWLKCEFEGKKFNLKDTEAIELLDLQNYETNNLPNKRG